MRVYSGRDECSKYMISEDISEVGWNPKTVRTTHPLSSTSIAEIMCPKKSYSQVSRSLIIMSSNPKTCHPFK
jgi:hypothetical protein